MPAPKNGCRSEGWPRCAVAKLPEKTVARLFRKGEKITTLARRFEVSPSTIRRHLNWQGITEPGHLGSKPKITGRMLKRFSRLYRDGTTLRSIAEIFRISGPSVRNYVKRLKLQPRRTRAPTVKYRCRDCKRKLRRKLRTSAYGIWLCKTCYDARNRAFGKKRNALIKREVLRHYSFGPVARCLCCGERNEHFLTIDHVNNDGAAHRLAVFGPRGGGTAGRMYVWLKRNGFPNNPQLQTLCANCQLGKLRNGGVCPHRSGS